MRPKHVAAAALAGTLVAVFAVPGLHDTRHAPPVPTRTQAAADLARLPVAFEPNVGQADGGTRFLARAPGYDLLVGRTGARVVLSRGAHARPSVLSFKTLGSNPRAPVSGAAPLPGRVNYFIGRRSGGWHTGIGTFRAVEVSRVYPGVDLSYSGGRGRIEYTFTIAPGADPAAVRLGVGGASSLRLDPAGDLVVRTPSGTVVQHAPLAYQTVSGRRRAVHAAFSLRGHSVGFTVSRYDRSAPLVIDPVLTYSTYLSGAYGGDQAYGVAVNSAGDIVVSGDTRSPSFPYTESGSFGGGSDAFVIELDPSGTSVVYSTYIGGNGDDEATAVALDRSGDAYLTGFTDSDDYPLQASLPNTNDNNQQIGKNFDAFVTELSADGSSLVYSTLVGGIADDEGDAIAVGSDGAAYITGFTNSTTSFPTTSGALRRTASAWSAFVTKLAPAGANPETIAYSTFLGGSAGNWQVELARRGMTEGLAIGVDSSGDAYVGGLTLATNFPTTSGAYRTSMGGADTSGFVSKLNSTGSSLLYSTYLGGNTSGDQSQVDGLVLEGGKVFVAGASAGSDFPTTSGAVQRTFGGGGSDAFVSELNPATSASGQLVYSTYLGGSDVDGAEGLAVDTHGDVFVTGRTYSSNFPTAHTFSASGSAFVAKIEPALSGATGLAWSSELGGGGDTGLGVATNGSGDVFVVGETTSTSFPTVNALVTAPPGSSVMGFLSEIVDGTASHVVSLSPASGTAGTSVTINGAGFTGATSVKFDGVAAPGFTVGSDTQITATVPPLAIDGNVTVTTSGGTSNGVPFDVVPVVGNFAPTHGVAGQVVDVTGTSLVKPTALTLNGLKIPVTTVAAGTHLRFTLPTTATSGLIAVTTANGVADTSSDTTPAFTVDPKITGFTPAAAAGGASVKIVGSGLAGATDVSFTTDGGWTSANVVSDTATAIVAQVPGDATPGPIRVTTASPASPVQSPGPFKPLPKVTSFAPADGVAGETTVTITGTNLLDASAVKFGTVSVAPAAPASATSVTAVVPGPPFSTGKVTVVTPDGTAVSPQTFAITKVTGIAPLSAAWGSTITITGQGLGSATSVDFRDTADDTNVTATATSVKVVVPQQAGSGPLVVHTMNDPAGVQTTQSFEPLPTIVFVLGATPFVANEMVTVLGSNFEPTGAAPTVKLGMTTLPLIGTPNQIAFQVAIPQNAVTGNLVVTTPEGSASTKLAVVPTIDGGPTPSSGPAGTHVSLTGLTFTGTTKVAFTGGATTPFTLTGQLGSPQTLSFTVPATAESGPITVTNAGGSTASIGSFTIDPAITSFTPVSGPVGATLTVKGSGLFGATSVTFGGGVTATPTSVTPTSLQVAVPQGVSAGTIVVHTSSGGDSPASAAQFTPTATLSSFSPAGGRAGTLVTINGVGFTGVTDVQFDGVSVGPGNFEVDSSTKILAFVPAGASDGVITVVRGAAPTSLTSANAFDVLSVTSLSSTDAHVGDPLTINGTSLEGTSKVTFGGNVDATPSAVTSTSVTVTVPDGVSTGTLTVTTDDFGTVTTPSVTIDPPEIDDFTAHNVPSGSSLTIDGAGFVGVTSITIGGVDLTSSATSTEPDEIQLTIPPGTAGGDIVVTTDEGTTAGTFTLVEHDNGLGQTSYDEYAGYSDGEALLAAFMWGETSTTEITCTGEAALQATNGTDFATWVYGDGTLQGYVVAAATPTCPTTSDHPWH